MCVACESDQTVFNLTLFTGCIEGKDRQFWFPQFKLSDYIYANKLNSPRGCSQMLSMIFFFFNNAQLLTLTCFGPSQITLSQTIHMHSFKVNKDQNVLGYKGVGL